MNRYLIYILCVLFIFFDLSANAQTMQWSLPPTDYANITHWNIGLFKVEKYNRIGIIRPDGTIVVPVDKNEITPFYQERSLVIKTIGGKRCVEGVLDKNGKYTPFKNKYYTIAKQEFFSCGVLTVIDDANLLGYIDDKGNQVLGFDGRFLTIKPFSEGYAVVKMKGGESSKKNRNVLVDKNGKPANIVFNTVASIAGITNVYDGVSYVMDNNPQIRNRPHKMTQRSKR